jgi:hypothetical protein
MMQKYIAQAIVWGVALLIAAILVVVGVGFLGAAVYFALCLVLTPPMAALATALCVLVAAIVVILIGRLVGRMLGKSVRRRPATRTPAGARGIAADLGILAGGEIAALVRSHALGTLLASLVAGFAVGASPGLRRLLRELVDI